MRVCTAANTVFPVIITYMLMYICGLRIVTRGGVLVPGKERRSHLMAHPHHAFQFIVLFIITVPCVMYRLCYSNNVVYVCVDENSLQVRTHKPQEY